MSTHEVRDRFQILCARMAHGLAVLKPLFFALSESVLRQRVQWAPGYLDVLATSRLRRRMGCERKY